MNTNHIILGDCLDDLRKIPSDSVDLVFTSPPYEGARTYGIGFNLAGQDWVDWALPRYIECVRVCRGLVAWVVEGRTKNFQYTATPALFMADLHRSGIKLRKPPIFHRLEYLAVAAPTGCATTGNGSSVRPRGNFPGRTTPRWGIRRSGRLAGRCRTG